MDGINDLGARLYDAPGVFIAGGDGDLGADRKSDEETDDVYFELEDPGESQTEPQIFFELGNNADILPVSEPGSADIYTTQTIRKIDPTKVSEGHFEIETSYEAPDVFANFDIENPEKLVGNLVKGRYKLIEFLGGDETGFAYLAEDRIVSGKTVLARVHFDGESDEMIESILAEERITLSHFSHPNIARMIDSGEFANGSYFLICEYIDGLSIDDILAIHGRFDPKRASRVIRQISNALNEAHQEGILHRDIRPGNIVIDPDVGTIEQAKLVNFGASNGEPNDDNLVYKSPEVIDGRINTIVGDIFSLAVVSYEMLTGRLPFEGKSKNDILRAQYAGPAAMPSELRPDLPPAVDNVFIKALSFKPAERYKRAREFSDALTTALAEVSAPQEEIVEQPKIVNLQPLTPDVKPIPAESKPSPRIQIPAARKADPLLPKTDQEKKSRSSRLPQERSYKLWYIAGAGILILAIGLAVIWYFIGKSLTGVPQGVGQLNSNQAEALPATENVEIPAQPRNLAQPPNTDQYQNIKENLNGDLVTNFVGFSLFYPKNWTVNGPQPSESAETRGKFLDISRSTADGKMQEQMLVSYYPSGGTMAADAAKFPQLVRETNETLKKILPGYQMISEGEIVFNGNWRAYEVKFQGGGTSSTGETLIVWGRRLYVPAARPGAPNGFEITMLATSYAENVKGIDEVGVRGELGPILHSFEPSQSF
jgi:serine/threonine protein kinase